MGPQYAFLPDASVMLLLPVSPAAISLRAGPSFSLFCSGSGSGSGSMYLKIEVIQKV